uniref:Transcription factor TFIIIB component B'' homolog n=2 Tax=Cacopsylla melanoneura TaxID=428564 RepID=A0A8D9DTB3_9HEMI
MSLRFLKAKPKLNLSKDKKVRSALRNEAPKTDTQGQSTNDKKIQEEENEKLQERNSKLEVVPKSHCQDTLDCKSVDTNTKECIKEVETSTDNSEHVSNEKSVCVQNTQVNLKSLPNSNASVSSSISKDFVSSEKTSKEELIDTTVLQEINSEKSSINSVNNSPIEKKTLVSKSSISCMKNVFAKEIPVSSDTIVTKESISENKIKDPIIGDEFKDKDCSGHRNEKSIPSSITNKNSTNIERKTSQKSVLDKPPPELKKVPSKTKESPTKTKESPAKTKSLSSYIKQLEHEKKQQLPSQENKEKNLSKPIEKEKAPNPKKRNFEDCTAKPTVPHVIKKNESSIEQICENERNTSLVPVPKPEHSLSPCKEEKPISFDLIVNKQAVKKSPTKRTKVIEARIQKISNLIEANMNLLKNSQLSLNSKKERKLDNSGINKNDVKRDCNQSEQGKNMILTEENILSIPVIMSNTSDGSILENNEILPLMEDHMYAKPTCVNISSFEEIRISHSNESSITRPEKSLASVKIKNLTHEEKKNRKKLHPSKLNGLNAFQRALILEEENKSEDDQMSEASECEPTPFVDVNACTFNEQEEEEDTAVNQISYSFHDKEFQEFSGLCLVTKFIKQENGDSFCPEMKSEFTSPTIGTESANNSNYFEEKVVYSENIIYIEDSTCDENIPMDEELQDDIQHNFKHQESKESQRKCNENFTSRQHRNVTFNFSENIKHESKDTKVKIENKTRKRKIKEEIIAAEFGVAIDVGDDESKNKKENETNNSIQVDIEEPKRRVKIKKDEDYEYLPVDEPCDSSSDLEIDIDERNFVINGKKMKGMKKKPSESIFLKRQHETLKKIKSQASWKDNLTVNDLIFYNPESNPMTNPPDISIVKTNNETILGKTEPSETQDQSEDEEAVDNPEPVPQLKISADGKLIVDPKSLIIEETGLKKSKERLLHSEALVESKYTIKKFDNLYSKRQIKRTTSDWSPEDTIMFYRALNTIGTDFSMMATLFENKTRNCIKRKFKLEERKNPTLLSKALRNFNSFDIDELKSELNADRLRAERIKKEEKERLEMIKQEKKQKKQSKPKVNRNTSLCGKLIQDSIQRNPPYVKPHFELYTVVNESNNLDSNVNITKKILML